MPEIRTLVTTYRLDYPCDACGAPVEKTGRTRLEGYLGADPIKVYHHKCPNCGATVLLPSEYPRLVHEAVEVMA